MKIASSLLLVLFAIGTAHARTSILEATADRLQQDMAAGRATSQSITAASLARLQSIDRRGPALNSVLAVNPDAVVIARQLDAERKARKLRGPLHGIPVLVKDNIDTGDRMPTTAGSLALAGARAAQDARDKA